MSRKKKPPTFEDLLVDLQLDTADIINELQAAADHPDSKLLLSQPARAALVERFTQTCSACRESAAASDAAASAEDAADHCEELQQRLTTLSYLASLMPTAPGDKLARVLLHGTTLLQCFREALGCIYDLCHQFTSRPPSPAVHAVLSSLVHAGRDIMAVVQDMACYCYTATSATQAATQQGTQGSISAFGREPCAAALMGIILNVATMDLSLNKYLYSLRRSACSTMTALCSHSRRNQTALIENASSTYSTLMGTVLPQCGDGQTQVELFEVMYRCSRVYHERGYKAFLNAQMRGRFAELLAKDVADVDLMAEIHGLVLDYNRSLQNPSVLIVVADKLQFITSLGPALSAIGNEVELGSGHLGFQLEVTQDGPDGVTYEETCDMPYDDIARVVVAPYDAASGTVQLRLLMQADMHGRRFPLSLGADLATRAESQARASGGTSPFKLALVLQQSECDRLVSFMQAQGVTIKRQSASTREGSQPEPKPMKVSMGNLPISYKRRQPLPLTKTTPPTDGRMPPVELFKTPRTAAPAAAAAAAGADDEAAAAAEDDAELPGFYNQEPSQEFGAAAAAAGAGGATAADLAATTPAPAAAAAGGGGSGSGSSGAKAAGRDSQMLDALLQTVQDNPGLRPSPLGSLMAGPSPDPAARSVPRSAAAAAAAAGLGAGRGDDDGDAGAAGPKATAPAAAVGSPGGRGQRQRAGAKGKGEQAEAQQQQAEDEEEEDGWADDDADEDVREDGMRSNSQEAKPEATPAGAAKTNRRNNKAAAAAAAAAAAGPGKGAGRQAANHQAAPADADEEAEAAAGAAPLPPAGKGKKAAQRKTPAGKLQLERRSRRPPVAKETQDPIQDPDLPSLQPPAPPAPSPAPAAAAASSLPEDHPADLPAWLNTAAAAGGQPHAASTAAAPAGKVTPYSSRTTPRGAAAAAAAAAAEGVAGEGKAGAAASPGSGGRRKVSRLNKLVATPQGAGKAPASGAKQGKPASTAQAAPAAAAGGEGGAAADLYAFSDGEGGEGGAGEDTLPDLSEPMTAVAAAEVPKGKQAAGKGSGKATAAGKGRKAPAAADKAAAAAAEGGKRDQQQQQQPQLSDFDFPASDSEGGGEGGGVDVAQGGGRGKKGGRGGKAGRGGRGRGRGGAAAAKAGSKRKAPAAAAGGEAAVNKQKQQRKGPAAAAGAGAGQEGGAGWGVEGQNVVFGTVDDDTAPASDLLRHNQPEGAAAGGAAEAAGEGAASGRQRASRASKSKALQAMHQQQLLLQTQPTEQQEQLDGPQPDEQFEDEQQPDGQLQDEAGGGVWDGGHTEAPVPPAPVAPGSPGAGSGSAGGAGATSDSDDATRLVGRFMAQHGKGPTTARGKQLARLLQAGQAPATTAAAAAAAAAATPDALKIDTAQVARKLKLTITATKPAADKRKQATAAAAAPAASGLRLPGLQLGGAGAGRLENAGLGSPSPAASDLDAGAADAAAGGLMSGFNLGLGRSSRQPGKGLAGLGNLRLSLNQQQQRPAAAAGDGAGGGEEEYDNSSEDEDDAAAAAAVTGFRVMPSTLGRQKQQQRRGGAFAAGEADGAEELEGSHQEDVDTMTQLLAKAIAGGEDDDSDDDDEDGQEEMVRQIIVMMIARKKQADHKRRERELKELEETVRARVAACQAQIKRESNELNSRGAAHAEVLLGQLEQKAAGIQALGERLQQEMQLQWQDYQETYAKAQDMHQKLRVAKDRGVQLHKRKAAELHAELLQAVEVKEQEMLVKRAKGGVFQRFTRMLGLGGG